MTRYRWLTWLIFVLVAMVTMIDNFPAAWVARWVAQWSGQRVVLAQSEGTLWQGSAALVLLHGNATGMWPDRVRWQLRLRPKGLEFSLESQAPENPGRVTGWLGLGSLHLEAGNAVMPAQLLTGLGAPFNTLLLGGQLNWQWTACDWRYRATAPESLMSVTIRAEHLASRLSPVSPLGDYQLHLDWGPLGGKLDLQTLRGPLMLTGQGVVNKGRLSFDGEATAEDAMIVQLTGLLSILGKREGAVTRLHY